MTPSLSDEIAASAARMVVEEGMEYGPAKRRAARQLGRMRPGELPSNDAVEDEVRAYLEIFRADSQPLELRTLRRLAHGRSLDAGGQGARAHGGGCEPLARCAQKPRIGRRKRCMHSLPAQEPMAAGRMVTGRAFCRADRCTCHP